MVLRGVVLPVAFAFSLPLLFGGQAIFAAVLCAEAVSYTHLDVYKRQALLQGRN